MAELTLTGIRKSFGGTEVISGLDLTVRDGAFCTLLGPSGSGKTTLLQIVAGLETLNAGSVAVGGRDISGLPPEKRNIGVVFQSYALFPHLTAADNVAYGLVTRGVSRNERRGRVQDMLDMVGLGAFATRKPGQLSGGQQQRVALARALVIEPDLLLLDEPLSALDKRIRQEMQFELARIHSETGLTTVMVTHDQEEALDLADQVVLLDGGRIQQDQSPREVYRRPANAFVSRFLGAQRLPAVVTSAASTATGSTAVIETDGGISAPVQSSGLIEPGQRVEISVPPEAVSLSVDDVGPHCARATVRQLNFFGPTVRIVVETEHGGLQIESLRTSTGTDIFEVGATVYVAFDPASMQVFVDGAALV